MYSAYMSNGRVNGRLITEWRKANGVSVETLASDVGVSTSLMRAVEKNYLPRERATEIIADLVSITGISAATLVTPAVKRTA